MKTIFRSCNVIRLIRLKMTCVKVLRSGVGTMFSSLHRFNGCDQSHRSAPGPQLLLALDARCGKAVHKESKSHPQQGVQRSDHLFNLLLLLVSDVHVLDVISVHGLVVKRNKTESGYIYIYLWCMATHCNKVM